MRAGGGGGTLRVAGELLAGRRRVSTQIMGRLSGVRPGARVARGEGGALGALANASFTMLEKGHLGMSNMWVVANKDKPQLTLRAVLMGGVLGMLPGVGKIYCRERPERMVRNPATGETIQIKAKKVVKFRVAKAAKDAILGAK